MTESPNQQQSSSFEPSRWLLVGWLGLGISLLAIALGFVLPFLVPPALKSPAFLSLYKPTWWPFAQPVWHPLPSYPILSQSLHSLLQLLLSPVPFGLFLGPWLAVLGFFHAMQRPAKARRRALQQVLGCQLILGSSTWLLWHIVQLAQKGLIGLRIGVYKWFQLYPSLLIAPALLALGAALLTQPKRRTQVGIVLAFLGYHILAITSFYLYFTLVVAKQFPLRFAKAPNAEIQFFQTLLAIAVPLCLVIGTLALTKAFRVRFHLLMTAPIWLPFFAVFFFWSLILHTTLYFLEDLTGIVWHPPLLVKILVLSWLCLPLFPLLLTIDFCGSLIRYLGRGVLEAFFPPEERTLITAEDGSTSLRTLPPIWIHTVGAVLLFTAPLWLLPAFAYWGIRLFVYESVLLPLLGRPQTPHQRNHQD